MTSDTPPLRVTIVQPSLAKYRVPVFRELAARPGVKLTVVHGETLGLSNVTADGFEAIAKPMRVLKVGNQKAIYHRAQLEFANLRSCDVLVLNWTPRYLSILPALFKARRNKVGVVLWGHGFSKSDRWWWRFARHQTAKLADSLLFYDETTCDHYRAMGWDDSRMFVAHNTIDGAEVANARRTWLSDPDRLERFRKTQGLEEGPVLLFVSRLQPANRVDLLLRATAELSSRRPSVKTVIIGSGDEERARLLELSERLGISAHVVFKDGIYDEQELAPWFLCSDVFCYPENIGLSIVHALRYGLPVVTSDCRECHNPEIVYLKPGMNGELYEHGDPVALATSVDSVFQRLASAPETRQRIVEGIEEKAKISRMVDGMVDSIQAAAPRR